MSARTPLLIRLVLAITTSAGWINVTLAEPSAIAVTVVVDSTAPTHDFPHFWEQMFGSGRAVLALRDAYRRDLREVKQATDFNYMRAHAIFHDEIGIYHEDEAGHPIYNFSYVDQIYD